MTQKVPTGPSAQQPEQPVDLAYLKQLLSSWHANGGGTFEISLSLRLSIYLMGLIELTDDTDEVEPAYQMEDGFAIAFTRGNEVILKAIEINNGKMGGAYEWNLSEILPTCKEIPVGMPPKVAFTETIYPAAKTVKGLRSWFARNRIQALPKKI